MTEQDKQHAGRTPRILLRVAAPCVVLACILIAGAYVRFEGLTTQGMNHDDTVSYFLEARIWAEGKPPEFLLKERTNPSGEISRTAFYRPTTYLLQGLAMRAGGINDYSAKALSGTMDVASIALLFVVAALLCRSLWAGAMASCLYAFLPQAVRFARSEYPHALCTTFVLLAFMCFLLRERSAKPRPWLHGGLLLLCGVFSGVAANGHADLAFIAPGYVVYLIAAPLFRRGPDLRAAFSSSCIAAATYSAGFFIPYAMGVAAFGLSRVVETCLLEINSGQQAILVFGGRTSKLRIPYDMLSISFAKLTGSYALSRVFLVAVPALMILKPLSDKMAAGRNQPSGQDATPQPAAPCSCMMYLPVLLVLSYALLYAAVGSSFSPHHYRLFLPLFPIFLSALLCWILAALRPFLGNYAAPLLVGLALIAFHFQGTLLPRLLDYRPYDGSAGEALGMRKGERELYDQVAHLVDEKHQLLLAPMTEGFFQPVLEWDIYLGENALYLNQLPLPGQYSSESLGAALERKSVRFVYIGGIQDAAIEAVAKARIPSKVDSWPAEQPYSLQTDKGVVRHYIRRYKGTVQSRMVSGTIYALPGKDAH